MNYDKQLESKITFVFTLVDKALIFDFNVRVKVSYFVRKKVVK